MKDRACRDILSILEQNGLIKLPPLRKCRDNIRGNHDISKDFIEIRGLDTTLIACSLRLLLPLSFKMVCQSSLELLWNQLMKRHHYLGHTILVGSYLKYLVYSNDGRIVSALGWGSPVWKLKPRDIAIGWTVEQRNRHLHQLANNQRFLILPWVKVTNLASYILSQNIRILNDDWEKRYGYRLLLLESFVDPKRFKGSCYRAANWIYVGQTKGFSKAGKSFFYHGSRKEVFLYPLSKEFRKELGCADDLLPALDHRYYLSIVKFEEPKRGKKMILEHETWNRQSPPPFDLEEEDIEALVEEFERFHELFERSFKRAEQKSLSCCYLQGLMSPLKRKSMEPIALNLMNTHRVRSLQHFMSSGQWSTDILSEVQKEEASKTLAGSDGVISVDGSDFVKKGKNSVGVARQWCSRLGKTENCQAGVFLSYSSSKGYVLIDRKLYLPETWFDEEHQELWEKCKIPDDTEFKTKNELALEMINQIQENNLFPSRWITCDSFFGRDSQFLDKISDNLYYFAEVPCNTKVWKERPTVEVPAYSGRGRRPAKKKCYPESMSVSDLAKDTDLNWEKIMSEEGAKGPIVSKVTRLRVIESRNQLPGKECWLFIRKSLNSNEIKYYLSNAPEDTSFEEMCRVSTLRWPVEQCFQEGKSNLGMDQYEHRSWEAWHRHMTFVFIAQLFLLKLRHKFKKNSSANITTGNSFNENCFTNKIL